MEQYNKYYWTPNILYLFHAFEVLNDKKLFTETQKILNSAPTSFPPLDGWTLSHGFEQQSHQIRVGFELINLKES